MLSYTFELDIIFVMCGGDLYDITDGGGGGEANDDDEDDDNWCECFDTHR